MMTTSGVGESLTISLKWNFVKSPYDQNTFIGLTIGRIDGEDHSVLLLQHKYFGIVRTVCRRKIHRHNFKRPFNHDKGLPLLF